jgi:hypothetical protein
MRVELNFLSEKKTIPTGLNRFNVSDDMRPGFIKNPASDDNSDKWLNTFFHG